MKPHFIFLINMMVTAACNNSFSHQLPTFIPGTYIRYSNHEFGTEYDTIVLKNLNSSTDHFQMVRTWRYERILDGKSIEPEYKRQVSDCIYNRKHKSFHELDNGIRYFFDLRNNRLYTGEIEYLKIK